MSFLIFFRVHHFSNRRIESNRAIQNMESRKHQRQRRNDDSNSNDKRRRGNNGDKSFDSSQDTCSAAFSYIYDMVPDVQKIISSYLDPISNVLHKHKCGTKISDDEYVAFYDYQVDFTYEYDRIAERLRDAKRGAGNRDGYDTSNIDKSIRDFKIYKVKSVWIPKLNGEVVNQCVKCSVLKNIHKFSNNDFLHWIKINDDYVCIECAIKYDMVMQITLYYKKYNATSYLQNIGIQISRYKYILKQDSERYDKAFEEFIKLKKREEREQKEAEQKEIMRRKSAANSINRYIKYRRVKWKDNANKMQCVETLRNKKQCKLKGKVYGLCRRHWDSLRDKHDVNDWNSLSIYELVKELQDN